MRFVRISALVVVILAAFCGRAHAQSWTAPWTATTGVVVTAAQLNQTRDNLLVLRGGGFSVTSQAIGDLLCASSTTQFARLPDVATGQVLISGGVGACPSFSATTGITGVGTITTGIWNAGALTTSGAVTISATNRLYLDGGGDSYIHESAANIIKVFAGGTESIRFSSDGFSANPTQKIYVDGGGDSYLWEAGANIVKIVAGGVSSGRFSTGGFAVDPTLAIFLDGGGNTFFDEVAADTPRLIAGTSQVWRGYSSGGMSIGSGTSDPGAGNVAISGIVTTSSVGTAALRTATGSFADTNGGDVTMNDYTFFPKIEKDDCTSSPFEQILMAGLTNASDDTVGYFNLLASSGACPAGSYDVRWRYITASDNPDIWVTVDNATGAITSAWQSEDPIETPISAKSTETIVHLEVPTVADVKAMYVDLEPTLRQQARAEFLAYLVQRGWATEGMTVADAIDQIPVRYRRAARLWAVRYIAKAAGVDPAELILETMRVVNGAIAPKPSFALVVETHRSARAARVAAMRSQAIERLANWVPDVPASIFAGGAR